MEVAGRRGTREEKGKRKEKEGRGGKTKEEKGRRRRRSHGSGSKRNCGRAHVDEMPFGRLNPRRRNTKWILSNAANHIEVLSVLGGAGCVACGRHSAVHKYDKCLRLQGTITIDESFELLRSAEQPKKATNNSY